MDLKYVNMETTDRLSFDISEDKNAYSEIKTCDVFTSSNVSSPSVLLAFQSGRVVVLNSSVSNATETIADTFSGPVDAVSTASNYERVLFAKDGNIYVAENTNLTLSVDSVYDHVYGIGHGFLAQKQGDVYYLRDREQFLLVNADLGIHKDSFLQYCWITEKTAHLCFVTKGTASPYPEQQKATVFVLYVDENNTWTMIPAANNIECGNSVKRVSQIAVSEQYLAWTHDAHNIRVFDSAQRSIFSLFLRQEHDPTAKMDEKDDTHIEAICINNARHMIASVESRSESVYITSISTRHTLFRIVLYSRARHLDQVLFLKSDNSELYAGCVIKKGANKTLRVTVCDTSNVHVNPVVQYVDYFAENFHPLGTVFARDMRTVIVKTAYEQENFNILKMIYRPFVEAGNVRSVIKVRGKEDEFLMPSIHGSLVAVWKKHYKRTKDNADQVSTFDSDEFETHVRELAKGSSIPGLAKLREAVLIRNSKQYTIFSILVFESKNHVPFRDVFSADNDNDATLIDQSVFYMQKPLFLYDYYLALRSVVTAALDMITLGIRYRLTSECFAFDSATNLVSVYKGLPLGAQDNNQILSNDAFEIIINGKYSDEFSKHVNLIENLNSANYIAALHEINRILGDYAKKYTGQHPHYLNRDFVSDDVEEVVVQETSIRSDDEGQSDDMMAIDSPNGHEGEISDVYNVSVANYPFFAPVAIKPPSSKYEYVSACVNALASSPGVQNAMNGLDADENNNQTLSKDARVLKDAIREVHRQNEQWTVTSEVVNIAKSDNHEATDSISKILNSLFPAVREAHNPFRFLMQESEFLLKPSESKYQTVGNLEGIDEYVDKKETTVPMSYFDVRLVKRDAGMTDLQTIFNGETSYMSSARHTPLDTFPDIAKSVKKFSMYGTPPPLFVMYVDRFPDSPAGKIKIDNPISPNRYISLAIHTEEGRFDLQYSLYGVISHVGRDAHGTEHVCYVQRRVSGNRLQWFRFDNTKCEKTNYDTVNSETLSNGCVFFYEQCTK